MVLSIIKIVLANIFKNIWGRCEYPKCKFMIHFRMEKLLIIISSLKKLRANGTTVFKPELSDFKPIRSTDSSLNLGLRLSYR